jgi:sulfate adenylyltransferase
MKGFTIFLTGLPGAGKSTTAVALTNRLAAFGRNVTLLDGDAVRKHLSSELGFSKEHRDLNIRRIGFVASEITRHGGVCICANIAPYAGARSEARAMVEEHGGFVLVHVATPMEVCEVRDPKGLYAKARSGLLKGFTGVSDPYEAPTDADITIDTSKLSPGDAAETVMRFLRGKGYLE